MNLRAIAQALGGEINGRSRIICPGPGHSRADRSLSVSFTGENFSVHSFAGDDWKACRDYVREKLGLPEWQPGDGRDRRVPNVPAWDQAAIDAEAADRHRTEDDLIRIKRAQELWGEASDPRGTLVERYLNQHRHLALPDNLAGTVLRFHPRCPWRDENTGPTFVPAMIAAFRSIDDDMITAVHRIALNPDGSKIDRRMLGVVSGAAVKLGPAGQDLAVAEGIETAMAAREMGIGVPVWAMGSVGAISFLPIVPGVDHLVLLAEAGKASDQAIQICGRRWKDAGVRVGIRKPKDGYSDFNDQLMRRAS